MPHVVPLIDDLTPDQEEIQYLPIESRNMIIGGPGSGKTSLAIHRTKHIKEDDPSANVSTFLFTNALNDFFSDGINNQNINSEVETWAKWQRNFLDNRGEWKWSINEPVPWRELSSIIMEHSINHEFDHLILDEAQDFSTDDLELMSQLAENLTVFADPNQRLFEHGVGDPEIIAEILLIDDDDTYHLKDNHRNTKEIIRTAQSFAPEEVEVDIDTVINHGNKPKIYELASFAEEVDLIKTTIENNKERDIGILHMENKVLINLCNKLEEVIDGSIQIELVKRGNFDFSNHSPKLCTLDSVKGLEFDIVIMPLMDSDCYWTNERNRRRIYVGMTRPKKELMFSYSGGLPTEYIGMIDQNTVDFC